MLKGDWYSWNAEDWEIDNDNPNVPYKIINETVNEVCSLSKSKYEYFPDGNNYFENHKLCKLFGGRSADVSTQKLLNESADFIARHCAQHNCYKSVYVRFNDIDNFNEWVDYETKQPFKETMIWNYGEPNGGDFENCAQLLIGDVYEQNGVKKWGGKLNDAPCGYTMPSLCEGKL